MPAEEQDFRQLVDDYLEDFFQFSPVNATHLGVHRYDDRLGERDRSAIDAPVRQLHGWLERLIARASGELTRVQQRDVAILETSARAELLALERQRTWSNDPTAALSSGGGRSGTSSWISSPARPARTSRSLNSWASPERRVRWARPAPRTGLLRSSPVTG